MIKGNGGYKLEQKEYGRGGVINGQAALIGNVCECDLLEKCTAESGSRFREKKSHGLQQALHFN